MVVVQVKEQEGPGVTLTFLAGSSGQRVKLFREEKGSVKNRFVGARK